MNRPSRMKRALQYDGSRIGLAWSMALATYEHCRDHQINALCAFNGAVQTFLRNLWSPIR